jgi:hypothetical protein
MLPVALPVPGSSVVASVGSEVGGLVIVPGDEVLPIASVVPSEAPCDVTPTSSPQPASAHAHTTPKPNRFHVRIPPTSKLRRHYAIDRLTVTINDRACAGANGRVDDVSSKCMLTTAVGPRATQ